MFCIELFIFPIIFLSQPIEGILIWKFSKSVSQEEKKVLLRDRANLLEKIKE